MHKDLVLIVFVLFTQHLFAQSPLSQGEWQLNGGFGLGDAIVYGGFDVGVAENITVGGQIAGGEDEFLSIGATGNYHFDELIGLSSDWNVYGGLNLGYVNVNDDSDIDLGLQAGARYFFNDRLGLNAEVGGGINQYGLRLGVTYTLQ